MEGLALFALGPGRVVLAVAGHLTCGPVQAEIRRTSALMRRVFYLVSFEIKKQVKPGFTV